MPDSGFSIEKVTSGATAAFKKNPVAWGLGGLAAVALGIYAYRGGFGGSGDYASTAAVSDPLGSGGGGSSSEDVSEDTSAEEIQAGIADDVAAAAAEYAVYNRAMVAPTPVLDTELEAMAANVMATPNWIPSGTEYSKSQVKVMSDWADTEQRALSSGAAGSSINPGGLADSGMTVTYHSTGHVSFQPKGVAAPKTTGAAEGAAGDAYRASTGSAAAAASKVIGQLAGKTADEKMKIISSAGMGSYSGSGASTSSGGGGGGGGGDWDAAHS